MQISVNDLKGVKVLVAGDIMIDRYLWGQVSRISPEAPVPVVKLDRTEETIGGAGNVGANLAGLGCDVTVTGLCGNDPAGESLEKQLSNKSIRHHLIRERSRPTITKTRIMAHTQQVLRLDEEITVPVADQSLDELLSIVFEQMKLSQAVVLSDYGKGVFADKSFTQKIIRQARKLNLPVLVDPKGINWQRYKGATCITPNTAEFEAVATISIENDADAFETAAQRLRTQLNLKWVLVTRGAQGMSLIGKGASTNIEAQARDVFDVSGAGDTVIATLAAGLGAGYPIVDAARIANLAAGIVVAKVGTQPVTASELETGLMLAEQGRMHPQAVTKLTSLDTAVLKARQWRSAGNKVVFTNGCFDLLHPGHISLFYQARALGHRLIVGLNTDESIRRLKGNDRPILSEHDRAAILCALECVDLVVHFNEDTPLELIKAIKPDILVKGSDYTPDQVVGKQEVESYGGRVQLVELIKGYSTTRITEKVLDRKNQA
ncbi:MAG: bifunctional D-glycero-beta-D-manno-heptose-7-phosphate kinase/D-glycero-beta-D-manno-heptose 1-phosphate adenylyltransferase HldE [Desulfobacteraceae bacterium]|nr:bifunctional D-glycero-beta-D-manno-heptose-7-phosphate kinase/D-glycero-beta-D-manno-heptose 1-phosphate adenylyltransferase HldE [Desulfobacteraceae bacterium]